ncbi:hypothetical protein [Oceanicella actignis]|uniref:VPLPA-CTERM protein sorting domain-containing protein n=1 Tax=Oceanicella actignis TaxID=1189325 RepID=A0A1M7RV81_9RHOB|nr:hypothetical protein [Oceanicella actignis]SET02591.1 VPLPA-CTERM protein sorting domain-containing protein [Oceanicella actignis]SHN50056.1 VPLPA-CTERM protein sorting domain-containing protein [Oceanicella actignis]
MSHLPRHSRSFALGAIASVMFAGAASASAIITNGSVTLGVDDFGQLNIPGPPSRHDGTASVGLRHAATGLEATSHGCLCEGWGVGIADGGGIRIASGRANNNYGVSNLSAVSFMSTASTATSVVELRDDSDTTSLLRITHAFGPAAETSDLYRVNVTIENISGAAIADLRYTRTFDWDIEPDTFSEVVTHAGVATTPSVLVAVDNGFVNSDPFAGGRTEQVAGGTGDFVDLGPSDHGSNFDFGFGMLAAGDSFAFDIFYGATRTETAALAALGEVGAELYSLGQPGCDPTGTGTGTGCAYGDDLATATFIFGFAGVGGSIIIPDPTPGGVVPLPAAAWLLLTGIGALGAGGAMRRRKA